MAHQQWVKIGGVVLKSHFVFVSSDPDDSTLCGGAEDAPECFSCVAYQHDAESSDPVSRVSLKQQLNNKVEVIKAERWDTRNVPHIQKPPYSDTLNCLPPLRQ